MYLDMWSQSPDTCLFLLFLYFEKSMSQFSEMFSEYGNKDLLDNLKLTISLCNHCVIIKIRTAFVRRNVDFNLLFLHLRVTFQGVSLGGILYETAAYLLR